MNDRHDKQRPRPCQRWLDDFLMSISWQPPPPHLENEENFCVRTRTNSDHQAIDEHKYWTKNLKGAQKSSSSLSPGNITTEPVIFLCQPNFSLSWAQITCGMAWLTDFSCVMSWRTSLGPSLSYQWPMDREGRRTFWTIGQALADRLIDSEFTALPLTFAIAPSWSFLSPAAEKGKTTIHQLILLATLTTENWRLFERKRSRINGGDAEAITLYSLPAPKWT